MRPVFTNDSIYVTGIVNGDDPWSKICALNASTGKVRWSVDIYNHQQTIFLIEPYLYAIEDVEPEKGRQGISHGYQVINAYDTSDGKKVWSYRLSSTEYPEAPENYDLYLNHVYDAILYNNTLILTGIEDVYKQEKMEDGKESSQD